MRRGSQKTLDAAFARRRRCPESEKATGLYELPPRRRRCLACNRLVRFQVDPFGTIVVGIHYVYPHLMSDERPR